MRYTVSAGPGDLGARVSVRRRLAEGGLTDVVGVVERWSDGVVVLRDRHGVLHELDEGSLVAAKRVPPPPVRR